MFQERIEFPEGQDWLMERMETLGDRIDKEKEGFCFAIAHMAMQADFADDLETFENRLKIIFQIDPTDFKETLENLEQVRLKIIEKVKAENKELPKDEIEALEKDGEVDEKIQRLKAIFVEDAEKLKKELTKEQIEAEFERRKKNILFNAFLQKKIDKEILKLPEKERLALDIPIFFQDVDLYQKAKKYREFFEIESIKKISDPLLTFSLVAPKKIKEPSKICKVDDFSGVYTLSDVMKYFESFSKTIEKFTPSITHRIPFILSSGNHAITVIYDPSKKNWLFIDANQLKSPTFCISGQGQYAIYQLVKAVTSAFSQNGFTTFSTKIYAHQSNAETLKKFLNQWKDTEPFKEIQKVTQYKASCSDSDESTWLHVASQEGHTTIVKDLLKAGAKVNQKNKDDGDTPLHNAADEGHTEIVTALLEYKADVNSTDKDGFTPLHVAVDRGQTETVKILLESKAKVNLRDNAGLTPLRIAAQEGYKEIVTLLLEHNPEVNLPDQKGITPLHPAAAKGHTKIVGALINAKADVNLQDNNGYTPLYFAAKNGHKKIVEQLLQAGADPNLVGKNKVSPLFIAAQNGHTDVVVEMLLEGASLTFTFENDKESLKKFADTNQVQSGMEKFFAEYEEKNKQNPTSKIKLTPRDIAQIMGHTEIVKILDHFAEQNQQQNISKLGNLGFFKSEQGQTVEKLEAKPEVTQTRTLSKTDKSEKQ